MWRGGDRVAPMVRPGAKKNVAPPSQSQLEVMKVAIEATAQITASMVSVTNEKNPAKISEAFKTIYKAIQETIKSP